MNRLKRDENFIENTARELAGFDNVSIQRELDEASAEWERELAEKSGVRRAEDELDRGFEALMKRIHDEKIQPVTEEMYEQQQAEDRRRAVRLKRFRQTGL